MPVDACLKVLGQVKDRSAVDIAPACSITGGSATGLSATDAWRGALSVILVNVARQTMFRVPPYATNSPNP